MNKPIVVYIDMDDVLCDFSKAHATDLAANPNIAFPQSQYGFFADLEPINGATGSVKQLISDPRFEVYILTAPSYLNPMCYTEKRVWIEKHFGVEFTKNLIISYNKALLMGDILIDDRAAGNGQDKFDGKLIQFGTSVYANWQLVMQKLESFV
jgi:5'(3')-deoxyribonucleotidase